MFLKTSIILINILLQTIVTGTILCQTNPSPIVTISRFPEQKVSPPINGFLNIQSLVKVDNRFVFDGVLWEIRNPLIRKTLEFISIPDASPTFLNLTENEENLLIVTRPTLSLPASSLFEGSVYTFRLTAFSSLCTGQVVTDEISFIVNDRPINGRIDVSPLIGNSITAFTLTTSGFIDQDLPLQFAFEFLRNGASKFPIPISNFSTSSILTGVFLSSLKPNQNFVQVICQDSLGAIGTALSSPITINPFYIPGKTNVTTQILNLDPARLAELLQIFPTEIQLRLFASLSVMAQETRNTTGLSQNDINLVKKWRNDLASASITVISRTLTVLTTVRLISLATYTFISALELDFTFGINTLEKATRVAKSLISQGIQAFNFQNQNFPSSSFNFIPDFLPENMLNVFSVLTTAIKENQKNPVAFDTISPSKLPTRLPTRLPTPFPQFIIGLQDGRRLLFHGRKIQKAAAPPRAPSISPIEREKTFEPTRPQLDLANDGITTIREGINLLLHLLGQGLAPGAKGKSFESDEIDFTIVKEFLPVIGTSLLSELKINQANVVFPNIPILESLRTKEVFTGAETVDSAIMTFKFNIHELIHKANYINASENTSVTSITSLHFFTSVSENNNEIPFKILDPFNLSKSINITIPLPDNFIFPGKGQTITCGAYDEEFEGFLESGCELISFNNKQVLCSCNHASDFAAWTRFVNNINGGPLGIIDPLAIMIEAFLFLGLILLYFLLMLWARYRDEKDAHGVHIGTLLLLTKNRIRYSMLQRQFLGILREHARRNKRLSIMDEDEVEKKTQELLLKREEAIRKINEQESNRFCCRCCCWRYLPGMLKNWVQAMVYDHTLLGLFTRFDPYYTRAQRITVIFTMVCGNLFINSFLFDLRTANDISFEFTLGIVFFGTFAVSLPSKFIIRFLFRSTQPKLGSSMDRTMHIFRISSSSETNLLSSETGFNHAAEKADAKLLFAFRQYYVSKSELKRLQTIFDIEKLRRQDGPECCCCFYNRCCSNSSPRGSSSAIDRKQLLKEIVDIEGLDHFETEENFQKLRNKIKEQIKQVKSREKALKDCCRESKKEWAKIPRQPSNRLLTLRSQSNISMKFASLLYDSSDGKIGRERPQYFRHSFVYFAWTLVLTYMAACLAYSAYWVLAYTSEKENPEDKQDTRLVISRWLLASVLSVIVGLFLAEPILQFLRFSLMTYILKKCGKGIVTKESRTKVLAVEEEKLKKSHHISNTDIEQKAAIQDMFREEKLAKKKGESHIDTVAFGFFDLASSVVEAIT